MTDWFDTTEDHEHHQAGEPDGLDEGALDEEALEAERAAAVAYYCATGAERAAHPPDLALFEHPALRGLMAELTRMHDRGWAPARPFVELAPVGDLGPVEHRAWLRVALPLTAPRLETALAALEAHAAPRLERAQRRANHEITRGRQ